MSIIGIPCGKQSFKIGMLVLFPFGKEVEWHSNVDKGIKLNVTDAFKERLVEEGYNPSYGARPLRRAVMRLLEDSLAEEVLSGRIKDGDNALVDIDDNKKVTINISSEESSQELAGANF